MNITDDIKNGTHKLEDNDIMTVDEVAKYLSIGRSTVFYYKKQWKIRIHKVFGKFDKITKKHRDGIIRPIGGFHKVFLRKEIVAFVDGLGE